MSLSVSKRLAQRQLERGRQYELQGKVALAIEAYRQACELDDESGESFFALGQLEASLGQTDAALLALEKAVRCENDPEYIEWRAYLYGRARRYKDALADYRSLFDHGEPLVRVNAGRMLLALRRYDEAEEVLRASQHETAKPLLDAIPRYREFGAREPADDVRAVRYLFGATLVVGTMGDGGHPLANLSYVLLTERHIAVTLGRIVTLVRARGWSFDGVCGEGPHHGPVAEALAELLHLPVVTDRAIGRRLLLASAVVSTSEGAMLRDTWRGCRLLHVALGLLPNDEPSCDEPHIVGVVSNSAAWWYRVESFARLEQDDDVSDGPWPGFKVGPAHVDPNVSRVAHDIVGAMAEVDDPHIDRVLAFFERHAQVRAYELGF